MTRYALALSALVALLGLPSQAHAVPRMTFMTGAPCSACHVNVQGGGMRTDLGWGSMSHTGMLDWGQLGVSWLDTRESNELFPRVAVGLDDRIQMARLGRPVRVPTADGGSEVRTPDREVFFMQGQPYLSVEASDWLTLYGTWLATRQTLAEGELCAEDYPGQSCAEVQAIFRPGADLPLLRAGLLQPSIGLRHDDHTMLIRSDAGRPVIPAQYAEWGGEITWQPRYWLQADAGIFSNERLSRAIGDPSVVDSGGAAFAARLRFAPTWQLGRSARMISWLGSSLYSSGGFLMVSSFAGIGLLDRASLILEHAHLRYGGNQDRQGENLSALFSLRIADWLYANVRGETASTGEGEAARYARSIVAGLEYFPLPFIELRPEYRYTRTRSWEMAQYTMQLHVFY